MHSSQHHVTLGLRFVEAFNRGEFDAIADMLHPDIEWYSSNRFLESETHIGRGDVKLYIESVHDHLVLINRLRGKGTLAGNEVTERYNWVVLMDDGLFRRVVAYPTPAEARRALEDVARVR